MKCCICLISFNHIKNKTIHLDVTPPNFPEGCPADKDVTAASFGEPTYVIYELPRATDNSNESIIAVGDPPSGFAFGLGITTVTVRASDSQGNVASCQFDILVRSKYSVKLDKMYGYIMISLIEFL